MNESYVITGGSSGIGYEIVKTLLANHNKVFILSRNAENCDLVDTKSCFAKNTDITDIKSIAKAEQWILKHIKKDKINGLINCAGVGYSVKLSNINEIDYTKIFDTNVKGLIFSTKTFQPYVKEHGFICNVSSIAGIKGFADWSVYSASKFAVEGFTQCIRQELRSQHIRVISIRPGSVDTPFYSHLPASDKKDFIKPNTIAQIVAELLELPPEVTVEDIFINNSVGDL